MNDNSFRQYIVVLSVIIYLSIIISPYVNLFSSWYITAIPVIVIYLVLWLEKDLRINLLKTTIALLLLVAFENHFIRQGIDFTIAVINQLIKWVPCMMALLCFRNIDKSKQKIILQYCTLLMFITSITTIIGVQNYPMAVRELAGQATDEIRNFYMSLNIGGYDFTFSIVLAIPANLYLISNSKKLWKILNIVTLITNFYCVYESQYTTALIIAGIILLLILIYRSPKYRIPLITGTVILIFFAGTGLISDIFFWLSDNVGSDYVKDRFLQVAYLTGGHSINTINTDTNTERLELTNRAIHGFLSSPLFGHNWFEFHRMAVSGHALVLDILSTSGILGFLIYIALFLAIFKNTMFTTFKKMSYESKVIWLAFIILSTVDPTGVAPIYMVIFFFATVINNCQSRKVPGY